MIILTNPCCCNTVPCDCTWRIAPEYATTGEGDGSALRVEWDTLQAAATAAFEEFLLFHLAECPNILTYSMLYEDRDPVATMDPLREILGMGPKGAIFKMKRVDLSAAGAFDLSYFFHRDIELYLPPGEGMVVGGGSTTTLFLSERFGPLNMSSEGMSSVSTNVRIAYVEGWYASDGGGVVAPYTSQYRGWALMCERLVLSNRNDDPTPEVSGAVWADPYAPVNDGTGESNPANEWLIPAAIRLDNADVWFTKVLAGQWEGGINNPDPSRFWWLTHLQESTINPSFPPDPGLEPVKYCSKIAFNGHDQPWVNSAGEVEESPGFNPNMILFDDSLNKTGDDPTDDCQSEGFGTKSISFGYRRWKVFYYLLTPCENESGSPIYARTYEEVMFPASITLVGGGGAIRYTGETKGISDSETWENIESWEMAPCPVVYDFVPCDDLLAPPTKVKSYSILDDGDVLFTDLGGGAKCWTNTGETFPQGAWDVVLGAFTMAPTGCEDPVCGEVVGACSWSYNGPFGLAYAYTTGPCPEVGHCVSYTDWMDGPTTGIVLEVWPNDDTAGGAAGGTIPSSGAFTDLGVAKSSVSADLSFFPVDAGSEPVVGKWYKQGGVCMVVDGVTTLATCDTATWAPTDGPFDTEAECNAA